MVPAEKRHEVEQLLRRGRMSRRQIARAVGIDRETVSKIERDRTQEPADPDEGFEDPRPIAWCTGCGHSVHMPCLKCHLDGTKPSEELAKAFSDGH